MQTNWLAGATLLSLVGCSGAWPEVVDTRSLSSGGRPSIARIRDLGTTPPPAAGPLVGESDGVASPGEFLLIEGSRFGKLPTVAIDSRAAELVARTAGGGIVARVPVGVSSGRRPVEVSVERAVDRRSFSFRRIGIAVSAGRAFPFLIEDDDTKLFGRPLDIPQATAIRVSADGGCAYVLSGPSTLQVIDLGAVGGPRLGETIALTIKARSLAVASRAPLLFAIGEGEIEAFETKNAQRPARYERSALPEQAKGATAVDVDLSGHRLALLLPATNRLVLVDVTAPTDARLVSSVAVLESQVPVVRDLAFAPDGETVWVVAGDNEASAVVGPVATRMIAVAIKPVKGVVTLVPSKPTVVEGAKAPVHLRVVVPTQLASATAIRIAPERVQLLLTERPSPARVGGTGQAAGALQVVHLDGALGPWVINPTRLSAIDATPTMAIATGGGGFYTWRLDGTRPPAFTPLQGASTADGDVRIQP